MGGFAVIDIVLGVLILLIVILSTLKGFIKATLSIASYVAGVLAGFFFYQRGAAFIRTKIFADQELLTEVLAFVILFAIAFIVVKLVQRLLHEIVSMLDLQAIDQVLGFAFGVVAGFALAAFVLFVIDIQPLFEPRSILSGSKLYQWLSPYLSRAW
ncbi:CvpA family protein [Breznakiellaceae bacterium SP9]